MKLKKIPINKPCPACGCKRVTAQIMSALLVNGTYHSGDWVECSKCGIQGPVKSWNKKRK